MESIEWKKVIITCVSLDAEVLARATTYKVPFQQKLCFLTPGIKVEIISSARLGNGIAPTLQTCSQMSTLVSLDHIIQTETKDVCQITPVLRFSRACHHRNTFFCANHNPTDIHILGTKSCVDSIQELAMILISSSINYSKAYHESNPGESIKFNCHSHECR